MPCTRDDFSDITPSLKSTNNWPIHTGIFCKSQDLARNITESNFWVTATQVKNTLRSALLSLIRVAFAIFCSLPSKQIVHLLRQAIWRRRCPQHHQAVISRIWISPDISKAWWTRVIQELSTDDQGWTCVCRSLQEPESPLQYPCLLQVQLHWHIHLSKGSGEKSCMCLWLWSNFFCTYR